MTNKEFVERLKETAALKTLYLKGGFGHVLNDKNKKRLADQYNYNKDIVAQGDGNTFAFDCCGLVKGIIWGFTGDKKKVYGGAVYESNAMPDVNEKGLLSTCIELSDNFTNILPGEFLYLPGHCGIYIGNNEVVESTPRWKNGVQITQLNDRKWKIHAKIVQINYGSDNIINNNLVCDIPKYYLRNGSRGMEVDKLQKALNAVQNAGLKVDGCFGPLTKAALLEFQKNNGLQTDGVYGPRTQARLREVLR